MQPPLSCAQVASYSSITNTSHHHYHRSTPSIEDEVIRHSPRPKSPPIQSSSSSSPSPQSSPVNLSNKTNVLVETIVPSTATITTITTPPQRSVICQPITTTTTIQLQSRTIISNHNSQKQQSGMDLSLSSNSSSSISAAISTQSPTTPSCSQSSSAISTQQQPTIIPPAHSRIKKVLKHYQATAILSLNGPDWFLPNYNLATAGGNGGNSSSNDGSSVGSDQTLSTSISSPFDATLMASLSSTSATTISTTTSSSTASSSSTLSSDNNNNNVGALELIIAKSSSTSSSTTSTTTSNSNNNKNNGGCGGDGDFVEPQAPPPLIENHQFSSGNLNSSLDLRTSKSSSLSQYLQQQKLGHQSGLSLKDHLSVFDPLLAPPPFPIQQPPLLTPPDQGPRQSERSETRLEGELIACFTVGGEKRLCVPQIFNIVLRDFSLQQIYQVIEELQINCSICTRDQMEVLKRAGDIPPMAPSCGLITKTDAHRLCSALLSTTAATSTATTAGSNATSSTGAISASPFDMLNTPYILIYHECFGRCVGRYAPGLYTHPSALCIQCDECLLSFNPYGFVSHSHRPWENRTVHWGFDPNNWRSYLLPIEDLATYDQTPLVIMQKLHLLMTDQKNLSQLMLLVNNNNNKQSTTTTKSTPPPCCTGGRKSQKYSRLFNCNNAEQFAMDKNLENIYLIMKEMKQRFIKNSTTMTPSSTTTISTATTTTAKANQINATSSSLKRKAENSNTPSTDNPTMILSKLMDNNRDSTSSIFNGGGDEMQLQNECKRIKSESPLDPLNQYNSSMVAPSLMSQFVYPFLQSYLTSGVIPASVVAGITNNNNNNFISTKKPSTAGSTTCATTTPINNLPQSSPSATVATPPTNYLSSLLTSGTLSKQSRSSTTTTPTQSVSENKLSSLTKELVLNSLFGNSGLSAGNSGHYSFYSNEFSRPTIHHGSRHSHITSPIHHQTHPIDRLLSGGNIRSSEPQQKQIIIKSDHNETPHQTIESKLSLIQQESAANNYNNLQRSFLPKNGLCQQEQPGSSSSSSQSSSSIAEPLSAQAIVSCSGNSNAATGSFWPTTIPNSAPIQQQISLWNSLREATRKSDHETKTQPNVNQQLIIGQQQHSSLMEDNLYNTIHMLQKMRHLSFELGMVPNLFEPSTALPAITPQTTDNGNNSRHQFDSSEHAQAQVEHRIQIIGQIVKDSSFDALKRNLSMIEYLIDDILVHLINNQHQIPSTGSIIMERFRQRLFTNILDFLEEIFGQKIQNITNMKASPHEPQSFKVDKMEFDDDAEARNKTKSDKEQNDTIDIGFAKTANQQKQKHEPEDDDEHDTSEKTSNDPVEYSPIIKQEQMIDKNVHEISTISTTIKDDDKNNSVNNLMGVIDVLNNSNSSSSSSIQILEDIVSDSASTSTSLEDQQKQEMKGDHSSKTFETSSDDKNRQTDKEQSNVAISLINGYISLKNE